MEKLLYFQHKWWRMTQSFSLYSIGWFIWCTCFVWLVCFPWYRFCEYENRKEESISGVCLCRLECNVMVGHWSPLFWLWAAVRATDMSAHHEYIVRTKNIQPRKKNRDWKTRRFTKGTISWNEQNSHAIVVETIFTLPHHSPYNTIFHGLIFFSPWILCFFSFSFTIHMITQINSARVFFSFFLSSYFPIRFSLVLLYLLCSAAMVWIISWSKHKTKTNALNEFMLSTFL